MEPPPYKDRHQAPRIRPLARVPAAPWRSNERRMVASALGVRTHAGRLVHHLRAVADEDGSDRATPNTASLAGRVWVRRGATLHILHPVSDRSSDRGDPAAPMPSGDELAVNGRTWGFGCENCSTQPATWECHESILMAAPAAACADSLALGTGRGRNVKAAGPEIRGTGNGERSTPQLAPRKRRGRRPCGRRPDA